MPKLADYISGHGAKTHDTENPSFRAYRALHRETCVGS